MSEPRDNDRELADRQHTANLWILSLFVVGLVIGGLCEALLSHEPTTIDNATMRDLLYDNGCLTR